MLYEQLTNDMKEAMKNKDKETLNTIRLLKSAIDLYKINNKMDRDTVSDDVVVDVASKQVKTHRESIVEFRNAGREDLASKLETEIKIIEKYLPAQLSRQEIEHVINDIFDKLNPNGRNDLGKVMKEANLLLKGKADMKLVSDIVMSKLN
mgnify:FL=1